MQLPDYVTKFMYEFKRYNFQIYLVGGAVRNILLGKENDNWDFTTSATPEQILGLFPDAFYHNTYGTVTIPKDVEIGGKTQTVLLEVTPFRKESEYTDNRHPDKIEWAQTIEEDLSRRDFTINALAYDGEKMIDVFEGKKHLEQHLIVAVGNADIRFQEDALRLLRGIRFAAQLGFLIDTPTREAIQRNAALIQNIAWERIRDEFMKILASAHPAEGVLFLRNTGLLQYILPEVDVCFSVPQKSPKRHHIYDVGTHLVMALKHCPSASPLTRFATLLHDIGKSGTFRQDAVSGLITFFNHEVVGALQTEKIAARFRLSTKDTDKLVRLVRYHQFTVSELQTDKAIRRFIREVGIEYVQDMLDLRTGDRLGSGSRETSWRTELFKKRLIEVQQQPFAIKDLKITGHDIMEVLDIRPGPQIGTILNELFTKVEEKELSNEREVLLQELNKYK